MTQDLEHQLAHYGATLRTRARAVNLEEVSSRRHSPGRLYLPGKAIVAGATLVLASIGVIFVGLALLSLFGSAPSVGRVLAGPTSRVSGPGIVALATGGSAVAVIAIASGASLVARRRRTREQRAALARERRKKKMQTVEKPIAPFEKLERSNRYLIIGLVVMTLLAAGFGAWLVVDNLRMGVEGDIDQLLADYTAAWEANDGDAVTALMTPDASLTAGNGVTYTAAELESLVGGMGSFRSTPLADNLIMETADAWYVASPGTLDYAGTTFRAFDVFKVVERDGRYLIERHETWAEGNAP